MINKPSTRSQRFTWMRRALEKRSASGFGIAMIVGLGVFGIAQIVPNGLVITVILAIILYEFQERMDQGVPLLQLTSLIAVLQYLVGPLLNYSSEFTFGRYSMYVSEASYFRFAIPATAFFIAIMLWTGASVKQKNLLQAVERRNFFAIGILLNVVAVIAMLASSRVGDGFQFLMHLMSQLSYVGAIYFLLSLSPLRLIFAAASCLQLFITSLGAGMFHDLILWLSILFCYWFAQRRWTLTVKLAVLTLAAICLFSIQVIKQEYREQLKQDENPSLIGLIVAYVTPGGRAWDMDSLSQAITRLNQGWIISAIMKHVPENEPFAEWETVKEAVLSSIAPRFFWAEKIGAGGRVNFRRFTGLEIADSTSMGISPLGEAYANFGETGGIGFMMVFGTLFALGYYGTLRYSLNHPTFLLWIPLIFYQAMKAETELSVIMNQLTKGAVVAFGCHYLVGLVFPVRNRKPAAVGAPAVPPSMTGPGIGFVRPTPNATSS